MTDILSTAGRNSSQTMELALAATEVVFRRMALGSFAMCNPAGADHEEFARMVPEKTQAFADAGAILISRSAQIGREMTRLMSDEMAHATEAATAVLTTRNPASMVAVQVDAGMSWATRLSALPRAMCLLALEAQVAVLAPIHRTATDNVERLRNRSVTP